MALPSSPPPIPQEAWLSSSPPQSPCRTVNKRRRLSGSAGLSSDPVFSDDASDVGLNTFDIPRRKRLIRGPWWTSSGKSIEHLRHQVGKRGIKVADSGVWMTSDDNEQEKAQSSDADLPDVDSLRRDQMVMRYKAIAMRPRPTKQEDTPLELASKIVLSAVEQGRQTIDLSSLALGTVSNALLRPLHQLIRHPHEYAAYRPLTPAIQLYLAGNNLTTLPTELFRFNNITVLSLRNNALRILPSAVFRLPRLIELNVSGNELNYLPWEAHHKMLDSCEEHFHFRPTPNPFRTIEFEQNEHDGTTTSKPAGSIIVQRLQAAHANMFVHRNDDPPTSYFLSSSAVTYFNNHGTPLYKPYLTLLKLRALSSTTTSAPSLFELALLRTQRAGMLHDALAMLPAYAPAGIANALRQAALASDIGNENCSTCGRELVIARAEWVEYWSYLLLAAELKTCMENTHRQFYFPYMRKACSYACARPSEVGSYRACLPVARNTHYQAGM